jgi:pimeloyl-ACP methyl ester carboxylesterase
VSDNVARTGYAAIGDLSMYYEIHGAGAPLLLLHGAYMTVDMLGALRDGLAARRQVIAPELQGHGRTNDVDRPMSYEQLADDCAALLGELGVEKADIVGYSMGGAAGLQLAIRHSARVRKLVVVSAGFRSDGQPQEALDMFPTITPELFKGTPMEEAYLRLAPDPGHFTEFVEKMTAMDTKEFAWPEHEIRGIAAPTLIVVGDSDGVRLEHAVEMFKLRGGGVMGDLSGLPASQLAVLPGTSHFVPPGSGMLDRTDWLLAMIAPFLDAPS